MKTKEPKKSKNVLKELYQTENGKTLFFFCFYAIFFLIVIILVRTSHNNPQKQQPKEIKKEVTYSYKLDLLEAENYHYKYLATIGENVFLYEGDRYQAKELFTVTSYNIINNYYRDGDLFIKQENALWEIADNPYLLNQFYEVEAIKEILKVAQFVAKKEYKNGTVELEFEISSANLTKLISDQEKEIPEDINKIVIRLDKNKNIEYIEYDLTNYYSKETQIQTKAILELSYSNFGKVKEIEKP